jgi:hypothetical protein
MKIKILGCAVVLKLICTKKQPSQSLQTHVPYDFTLPTYWDADQLAIFSLIP